MSSSMKYLGAATDPGEWWCHKSSEAADMGPGVSFGACLGEDHGTGPYIFAHYGLREDVNLPAVHKELDRLVAEYKKPDKYHREGRRVQGPTSYPKLEDWRTLSDVLENIRTSHSLRKYKQINQDFGKIIWPLRTIVESCCGSYAMADRVIELAGIDTIKAMYDEVT